MGRGQSGPNRWDEDEWRWSSLMSDAQSGDRGAYEMLLSELGDAIEDYVRSRFGAFEVLEDCVQESLLALHGPAILTIPASRSGPGCSLSCVIAA